MSAKRKGYEYEGLVPEADRVLILAGLSALLKREAEAANAVFEMTLREKERTGDGNVPDLHSVAFVAGQPIHRLAEKFGGRLVSNAI